MSVFLTALLNVVQTYGYPALWVSIFVAAIGFPLPISLVLLAAGAFAALGDFNIVLLTLLSISASVAGDNLGYLIGRLWGSKLADWLERSRLGRRLFKPNAVARSRLYFKKRGGWAIFFSRFLVAALGGIVNLLAGAELYPYRYFLPLDIAGEALGALIPLVLGFAFGATWDAIGDILGTASLLVLGLLLVVYLFTRLLRYARSVRAARVAAAYKASIIEAPLQSPEASSGQV